MRASEMCSSKLSNIINSEPTYSVSFGNRYDDNALDFLNKAKEYGIELPRSVTHYPSSKSDIRIDRSVNGGFLDIDKSIIRDKLKEYLESGKITSSQHDELISRLNRG